mmetsp:Transcript_31049/g.82576  ORF Transcript_31049/g.82576 Transcript_31049/m.82576 type:complete len:134 (-) Transcript_31049:1206-1607(-)
MVGAHKPSKSDKAKKNPKMNQPHRKYMIVLSLWSSHHQQKKAVSLDISVVSRGSASSPVTHDHHHLVMQALLPRLARHRECRSCLSRRRSQGASEQKWTALVLPFRDSTVQLQMSRKFLRQVARVEPHHHGTR